MVPMAAPPCASDDLTCSSISSRMSPTVHSSSRPSTIFRLEEGSASMARMLPGWFWARYLMTMAATVVLPTPPLPARAMVVVMESTFLDKSRRDGQWHESEEISRLPALYTKCGNPQLEIYKNQRIPLSRHRAVGFQSFEPATADDSRCVLRSPCQGKPSREPPSRAV